MGGGKQIRAAGGADPVFPDFSTPWKKVFHSVENFLPALARKPPHRGYFFTGRGGWCFFIQASWTIIMTWLVDQ